ncbi:MAG: phosphatase PAP2 family protein [Bulleidia sp.]|nr:phosphatase PAP2 family protein [Bulleidia sp.]
MANRNSRKYPDNGNELITRLYGYSVSGSKWELLLKYFQDAFPMIVYCLVYLIFFHALEKGVPGSYHVIHSDIDDHIPFLEIFIIPYLGWFFYVGYHAVKMYIHDRKEYHRLCTMLVIGMSVFILVSAVWPNRLLLRPVAMPRNNIFTDMVKELYVADTPTNVFPSIHVFNTLAVITAVWSSDSAYARKPFMRYGTLIFGILIILSTMFLKQHSAIDVTCAFLMWYLCRVLVYQHHFCFIRNNAEKESA